MADNSKGYWPTKDGRFKGRRIECGVCGQSGRRKDMVMQRGYLVHRTTCKDKKDQRGSNRIVGG